LQSIISYGFCKFERFLAQCIRRLRTEQEARVPGSLVLAKPYEPAVLGRLLAVAVRATPVAVPT